MVPAAEDQAAFREEEEPAQEDLAPAAVVVEQAVPASAAAYGMRAAGPGAQEGSALVVALAGREAVVGVVEPGELEEAEPASLEG